MRFVKATERLPIQATGTEIVVKYKGYLYICKAIAKKFVFREGAIPGNNILGEFEYENIEWLDMDEQDEGWVPVESPPPTNEKFNESEYYLCLLESTEYVVCWYNSIDKVWRVANFKADSLPLIGITHYRKLPQPPATT